MWWNSGITYEIRPDTEAVSKIFEGGSKYTNLKECREACDTDGKYSGFTWSDKNGCQLIVSPAGEIESKGTTYYVKHDGKKLDFMLFLLLLCLVTLTFFYFRCKKCIA